jgi:hypothetical protein
MATTKNATTSQVDEIEAYFERKAYRQAPAWLPEPGSTLKGEVIGLKLGMSEYKTPDSPNGEYPIIIYKVMTALKPIDGVLSVDTNVPIGSTVSIHAFHSILRTTLAELGTDIGKTQWVTYDGKQASRSRKDKDGNPVEYHLYDVENDGEPAVTGKDEGFKF